MQLVHSVLWLAVIFQTCLFAHPKGETCQCCMGPQGIPGNNGHPGEPGYPGSEGSRGQKGDKGDKGKGGQKGSTGSLGPTGDKGDHGKKGDKGSCGPKGLTGVTGPQGIMGPMGPKGEKGIKGDKRAGPAQIAFFVSRTSRMGPVSEDTTIEFDKVFTNTGNGFSILTSHFECKKNGTYIFHVHILSQEDNDGFVFIMLNKLPQIPIHADHRGGFGAASNTMILKLTYGDQVWVTLKKGFALSNDSSTFSGYLIFEED